MKSNGFKNFFEPQMSKTNHCNNASLYGIITIVLVCKDYFMIGEYVATIFIHE